MRGCWGRWCWGQDGGWFRCYLGLGGWWGLGYLKMLYDNIVLWFGLGLGFFLGSSGGESSFPGFCEGSLLCFGSFPFDFGLIYDGGLRGFGFCGLLWGFCDFFSGLSIFFSGIHFTEGGENYMTKNSV